MPWSVKDVEKHKKGLSTTQKEKWVRIANGVRADCIKKGGDEKTCDAKAIRVANSQVNSNMQINFETLLAYTPRQETYEGRNYLVVPVVMLVEGVHSGSRGPVYHNPEEFGKIVDSWNGIPVTLTHPVNEDGEFVPANSPDVLSSFAIGQIFNAHMEDQKLKAEAWLDIQKMTAISPQALQMVQKGEMIEVSVGIFSEEVEVEGDWNGEHYIGIVKNYRPNHLALLPGEVGACSVTDGCGFRVNKQKGGKEDVNVGVLYKNLNKQGFTVSPIVVNEVSFREIIDQIYTLVDSKDSETENYYLEEVYDDYIIFRKRKFEVNNGEISSSEFVGMYKQMYQVDANDKIQLVGDPVEVKKNVTYVTMQESQTTRKRTKFNNNNESKEENSMCEKCPEKVEMLIANSATHFSESDKEWLGELSEDKLDKLIPKVLQTNKSKDESKTVTEQEAWAVLKLNKDQYDAGVKIYNEQRADVTKEILDNSEKDTWKEEDLKGLKLDVLKKIAKSLPKKNEDNTFGNYAGMGAGVGGNGQANAGDDAPYIPEIEFSDKK